MWPLRHGRVVVETSDELATNKGITLRPDVAARMTLLVPATLTACVLAGSLAASAFEDSAARWMIASGLDASTSPSTDVASAMSRISRFGEPMGSWPAVRNSLTSHLPAKPVAPVTPHRGGVDTTSRAARIRASCRATSASTIPWIMSSNETVVCQSRTERALLGSPRR